MWGQILVFSLKCKSCPKLYNSTTVTKLTLDPIHRPFSLDLSLPVSLHVLITSMCMDTGFIRPRFHHKRDSEVSTLGSYTVMDFEFILSETIKHISVDI